MNKRLKVFMVGAPHSGKSDIFEQIASGKSTQRHYLRGSNLTAGYFAKVWHEHIFEFFDLPGFDEISESSEAANLATLAMRQEKPERILFVLSNQNFERQLQALLSTLEWGIPVLLVANESWDKTTPYEINWKLLSETFQTTVHRAPLSLHMGQAKCFYENLIKAAPPRLSQRQKEHPQDLLKQIILPQPQKALPWPKLFSENFYKHWSFFPITLAAFVIFLMGVNKVILGIYSLWMERTILGRYVHSFCESLFKIVGVPLPLQDILIGNYGVITLGLAYALAFVYPLLFTTYLLLNTLTQSHYLEHLKVWFMELLKSLRLPEHYFLMALSGLSCNLIAIQNIKKLASPQQKFLGLIFLMLGVPCAAQSLVFGNILLGINPLLLLLFLILMTVQASLLGWLLGRTQQAPATHLMINPQPLQLVPLKRVWNKSLQQLKNSIPGTLPLLLGSSFILAVLDGTGILQILREGLAPFLGYAFGLPPETTDVFLVGFFRRDFGAVGLYNLTNQGNLNMVQTVVCLSLLTFFYPCFASLVSIARNFSQKIAWQVFGFLCLYNLLLASALNWVLNL
jgi:Fe2+ transport system protein B